MKLRYSKIAVNSRQHRFANGFVSDGVFLADIRWFTNHKLPKGFCVHEHDNCETEIMFKSAGIDRVNYKTYNRTWNKVGQFIDDLDHDYLFIDDKGDWARFNKTLVDAFEVDKLVGKSPVKPMVKPGAGLGVVIMPMTLGKGL